MKFLKKIQTKEKIKKSPRVRLLSQKKANRFVLIVGCALFGLSLIGAIRANVMAGNVTRLSSRIEELQNELKQNKEKKRVYDSSALSFYVRNFVNEYINFNGKATDEVKQKRNEKLSSYFSGDLFLDKTINNENKEVVRKLLQVSVTRVEEVDDLLLVHASISYKVQQNMKETIETQEIVLPIKEKNGLFTLVARPYFLAMTVPKGKEGLLQPIKEPLEIAGEKRQDIEKFLHLFFEKYAKGNKQELSVLMKEPEKTSGQIVVLSIDEQNILFFDVKEKDAIGVQISVNFKDRVTDLAYTEDFTLWLTKTENSYFVQALKHYYTEKVGD
ncbi:conjugal transfer protein [Enterococcus faecalis]|uniref:conjugal transfer protein n=1 Tax=Enterococcus faecalis TaxID=1351 RepID=UPI001C8BA22F|nr:conjugal transfer protein [Enterococcus faecalis]MBX8942296.1 conjugal transfer protein [Enterococcus faecalis]